MSPALALLGEVVAPSADGREVGRARVQAFAQVPRVDLQVILLWDIEQTDVDLHVKEPSGEVVFYKNREGSSGMALGGTAR